MQQKSKVTKMVLLALLGVISFLIENISFPIPTIPIFLKVDFSELPALVGAILFGPLAGIVIEFIKNAFHLMFAGGEIIGVIANFLAGSIFVSVISIIYRKFQGWKGFVYGFIAATLMMTLFMAMANFFVFLPLYAAITDPTAKTTFILNIITPFNLIKGILVSIVFVPFYLKIVPYLRSRSSIL
ncbi:ECF transporter S component [Baia soyae]|uniref:Riboflavin transporter n=1 Tax=Baia soyae TaxID=1544746 RepID=A0A4R2RY15_9BACL|nr:ECF transporter S component [Baia soyae]TCP69480.1 riboflavin transporter FmnP [Baia soyae]